MKWVIVIGICFLTGWALAVTQVTIQGAKVQIQGAKVAVQAPVLAVVVSTSTTGQCIGILCGVTHFD